MPSRHKLIMQIRMLFGRKRSARQLQDELHFHLDQQISENMASGMTPEDARQAAIRAFGDPQLVREQARATWNWYNFVKIGRDLKYGVRTLLRSPGFAIVSVLVMALGRGDHIAFHHGARGSSAASSVSRFRQAGDAL